MKVLLVLLIITTTCYANEKAYIGELTAYCPCIKCCGTFDGKVRGQTASGVMAKPSHTLAAPREIPFGTKVMAVFINGTMIEIGVVEDRGGAITKEGNKIKIDIYFDTHKEALEFGRKKNVLLFIKEKK